MSAGVPEDFLTIPFGRGGDPQEVSNFVLFLASDESGYSTVAEFVIDGGAMAGSHTNMSNQLSVQLAALSSSGACRHNRNRLLRPVIHGRSWK
jgi:hypothetical protein